MSKKENLKDAVDAARSNLPITSILVKIRPVKILSTRSVNAAATRKDELGQKPLKYLKDFFRLVALNTGF